MPVPPGSTANINPHRSYRSGWEKSCESAAGSPSVCAFRQSVADRWICSAEQAKCLRVFPGGLLIIESMGIVMPPIFAGTHANVLRASEKQVGSRFPEIQWSTGLTRRRGGAKGPGRYPECFSASLLLFAIPRLRVRHWNSSRVQPPTFETHTRAHPIAGAFAHGWSPESFHHESLMHAGFQCAPKKGHLVSDAATGRGVAEGKSTPRRQGAKTQRMG